MERNHHFSMSILFRLYSRHINSMTVLNKTHSHGYHALADDMSSGKVNQICENNIPEG
jgi:hypothetical protein